MISFEGAFARSVRPVIREGADLLVIATNEATFGDSPATDQFIGMTRMRAAEHGVAIVHAAITGRSAFITADGSIQARTDLFSEEAITGALNFRSAGMTLYTRWGDWVQYLALASLAVAYPLQWRRARASAPVLEEPASPNPGSPPTP